MSFLFFITFFYEWIVKYIHFLSLSSGLFLLHLYKLSLDYKISPFVNLVPINLLCNSTIYGMGLIGTLELNLLNLHVSLWCLS